MFSNISKKLSTTFRLTVQLQKKSLVQSKISPAIISYSVMNSWRHFSHFDVKKHVCPTTASVSHFENRCDFYGALHNIPDQDRLHFLKKSHCYLKTMIAGPSELKCILDQLPKKDRLEVVFAHLNNIYFKASDLKEIFGLLNEESKTKLFEAFSKDDYKKMIYYFGDLEGLLLALPNKEQLIFLSFFKAQTFYKLIYEAAKPAFILERLLKQISLDKADSLFNLLFNDQTILTQIKAYYINYIIHENKNPLSFERFHVALSGLPTSKHRFLIDWLGAENIYNLLYGANAGPDPHYNLNYILEKLSPMEWPYLEGLINSVKYKKETICSIQKMQTDEEILSIATNASIEDIQQAFRKKTLEYHPDINGDNKYNNEQMQKLIAARSNLMQKKERSLAYKR